VTLHFAEIYTPVPGRRVFGVSLEGEMVLRKFEPVAAGFATAQAKSFETRVMDGFLDLEFIPQPGWPAITGIEIDILRGR
jgi:hypothetical protein